MDGSEQHDNSEDVNATISESEERVQMPDMYAKPICSIVIGMAGSGKSTLIQRLQAYGTEKSFRQYFINLDPAVKRLNYGTSIDIRDTVDYKQVMKEYNLGPNGAIMTALNLFATRFDQVINLVAKRTEELDYAFLDTPGQIEAFTWSASGSIMTESLATAFPTVLLYVIDTPRSIRPNTFMSNMLYACSILYKIGLPFVLVFNKTDVLRHDFAVEWMTDFEAFQKALDEAQEDSYMNSFSRSLSLVLEEFYNNLHHVGVSAATGEGMDALYEKIELAAKEYEDVYVKELKDRIQTRQKRAKDQQEASLARMMQDVDIAKSMGTTSASSRDSTAENAMGGARTDL